MSVESPPSTIDRMKSYLPALPEFFSKRRRTIASFIQTEAEHTFLVPASDPQDRRTEAALLRLNNLEISPSKNPRKRPREDDDLDELATNLLALKPDDSISQVIPMDCDENSLTSDCDELVSDDEGGTEADVEDELDDEEEVSPVDKVKEYVARQTELELRKRDIAIFKENGNHEDELLLFEKISLRGHEKILPASWQVDFLTLPLSLFTDLDESTFIQNHCTSRGQAVKALQSLLTLGVRVRDNISTGSSTERLIAKELRSYIKWSERDGGFEKLRFIPVLTFVAAKPGQSISSLSQDLTSQMEFLAEKNRHHLALPSPGLINEIGEVEMYIRPPPLLYGIIVAQAMTIIFTLDSADPDAIVKHLSHSQFTEKKMDVWNELSVAFTVIMARNYIMSIKDELEPDDEDPDPDA